MLNKKFLLTSSIIVSLAVASVASAISSQGKPGERQNAFKNEKPEIRSPFGPIAGPIQLVNLKKGPSKGVDRGEQKGGKGQQLNNRKGGKNNGKNGPSGNGEFSKGPSRGNGPKFEGPKNKGPHHGKKINVPDGGLTFAMLGSALAGLAFIKRKQARS